MTLDNLYDLPAGWRDAFGESLVADLNVAIGDRDFDVYLKEKWGSLTGHVFPANDTVEAVLDKYEKVSRRTCAGCGAPATRVSMGWIEPWCDDCGSVMWSYRPIEQYWQDFDGED